uniref:DUF4218 domain-containing protein n=1 Tax=Chenopodium quinoa TaxID=63459 RepID=A0A803MSE6_CHEQI
MYEIERYLHGLKQDVQNKARPEGSMAEGYLAKECFAFVARFLKGSNSGTPQVNACSTSQSFLPEVGCPIKGKGRTSKKKDREHILYHNQWVQEHRYVLFNCDCEEVEKYTSEHKEFLSARGKRKWNSVQDHNKDFVDWFREKVDFIVEEGQEIIPNNVIWLSKEHSYIAKKYTGYSVNSYRFHTMKRDANCVTQNSRVTLTAMTHSFASSKDQSPIEANVNYYEDPYHGSLGDSNMEQDTLGTGKRQVSSQQHPVPTREIQRKQQEQQLGSTKASVKKRAFCSPGSISAYLEFQKR